MMRLRALALSFPALVRLWMPLPWSRRLQPQLPLPAPLPLLSRLSLLSLVSLLLIHTTALAVRDPMEPPASPSTQAPRTPAAAALTPAAPAAPLPVVRHIVTVAERHFVVVGARRHAAGDRLGDLRIECVHADGVVARDDAGVRHHLPLFSGVAVRPAAADAAGAPALAAPARATPAECPATDPKLSKRKSP